MIDFEALLLRFCQDTESMRGLLAIGIKDEVIASLSDEAEKVWKFSKGWYQRTSTAVPEKVLLKDFEQYVRVVRENGDEELNNVDLKWFVDSLQRDYLYERFKGRIADAHKDGTFSRDLDFTDARKRSREVAQDLLKVTMNSSADEPLQAMTELLPTYLDDVLNYNDKIKQGAMEAPVTFGFKRVNDQYLGLASGEMMVLIAYTGMGKSFMMCKFALSAALQGKRVALWTLENSVEETMTRLAALAGHLPYDHLSNKVIAPPERQKLSELVNEEALSRLYIKQPMSHEGATLEEIYWESQNLDIDLIVGDQLSHVYYPGERSSDPDWLNETNKLRYARDLSRESNMASIWAAQANVKAHGKARIDLTMMARSQGYNQGSDFVFGLTDPGNGTSNIRRFECIKARRGPNVAWELVFNYSPMDIEAVAVAP